MKKQNIWAAAAAAALILTACASAGESDAGGTQAGAAQDAQETEAAPAEPVEMWMAVSEDASTLPEGSVEVLQKHVKEKFGVDLRIDCINKSSYAEKVNVMIASGDFPDIIDSRAIPRLGEAVDGGLLLSVDDLLAEDELWSQADPDIFLKFSYSDQVYGLPVVMDKPDGIYYRTDWLENLGLSVPTNAEELYQVMKAFTEQDPDGNGADDTYGLSMSSEYNQAGPLWQLFLPANPTGTEWGFYIDTETGEADNVFYHREDMIEALNWFRKLYDEGILDPEFVLTTSEDAESKFITGKSGCWLKGVLWIEPRQAKIQAANPEAGILCFPCMDGTYGVNLKQQPTGRAYYLTRSAAEYEDLAKEVLAYIAGPEGMEDLYIGEEGTTYTVSDGVITWTTPDDASKYNPGNLLSSPFEVALPVESPLLEENLQITADYETVPVVQISESATYNEKGADMSKVILEGVTKIIIGEQPVEYLDTITADLESLGMAAVCEELNAAQ